MTLWIPNVTAWKSILCHIQQKPGSNLSHKTGCCGWDLMWFSSSLHVNPGLIPHIRLSILPSTSYQLTLQNLTLKVSLNKLQINELKKLGSFHHEVYKTTSYTTCLMSFLFYSCTFFQFWPFFIQYDSQLKYRKAAFYFTAEFYLAHCINHEDIWVHGVKHHTL